MNQIKVAGLLYLLLSIAGIVGSLYIPNSVIVSGDAAATAENLRVSEGFFRLGLAIELFASIVFLLVAAALYRVFRGVNRDHASLMVLLVVAAVPVSFVAVVFRLGALAALSGDSFLSVFSQAQLESLAYLLLRVHSLTYSVVQVFHGLWLFPLAALALRSGVVPRIVGAGLVVAGAGYVIMTLTNVVIPDGASVVSRVTMPLVAGELGIVVWLLATRTRAAMFSGADPAAI